MEGLASITLGRKTASIVKLVNNWMIYATGIANVIFSVKFLQFASCNLNVTSVCNNNILAHLIAFGLSVPFCLIGEINFFVTSSLIATFFILTSVLTVAFFCGGMYLRTGMSSTTNFVDFARFGEFFGVVCFSVEGIGLMLPIRSALKKKEDFRFLFNGVCIAVIMYYFIYGSLGALVFGSSAKSIILFNFGQNDPVVYIQSLLYALGIFVSFPYVIFPLGPSLKEIKAVKKIFGVSSFCFIFFRETVQSKILFSERFWSLLAI